MTSLDRLFRPQSVAIIGASADPKKTAGRPMAYLRKHGFTGQIWPVNPKVDAIDGLTCYRSVSDLPGTPDVAMVMLGAARVPDCLAQLAKLGTKYSIVVASGFGETDELGAQRQASINELRGQMRVLGPNTIGLVNVTDRISLSASGALEIDNLQSGSIALVSQSGGILGSILSRGAAQGLGFSKLISTSNEADLTISECIEALAEDDATRVIALYVETIRDPVRFRQACEKAHAAGKPIVAYKVGRSEAGARAAVSHTGAMAGDDQVYGAFFESVGVIRVSMFNDLLDISAALAQTRTLVGQRLAILTSTGGAGTLLADNLGVHGLQTPPPSSSTASRLRDLQQGDQAVLDRNPIDVTLAGLDPVLLRQIIKALLASDDYDGLLVVVGSSSLARPHLVADAIAECAPESSKPILAYISPHAPNVLSILRERNIAAFTAPEACANACMALWQQHQINAQFQLEQTTSSEQNKLPPQNIATTGHPINEYQAYELLGRFGIASAKAIVIRDEEQAREAAKAIGVPTVLKMLDADVQHKSELDGVMLNQTPESIGESLQVMRQTVTEKLGRTIEAFMVQEQRKAQMELIVGLKRDALGTCLLVGSGGVQAELLSDTACMMLHPDQPLRRDQALALLRKLKTWPLLNGYRGKPALDTEAIVSTLTGMDALARALGLRLAEAEINPLMVGILDQGAVAADALVVMSGESDAIFR